MKAKGLIAGVLAFSMIGATVSIPTAAVAQSYKHRQEKKNEWRNMAYLGAGLGVLGLLNHDSTLTFLGTAGALYSANRYEQDRKSQNKMRRARASIFARGTFTRNGHTYKRYTTYRKGKKYYYFRRIK